MRAALGFGVLAALALFAMTGGATARPDQRPVLRIGVNTGGHVSTSDDRLRCFHACSTTYARGRVLRLTATPGNEFVFDHWDGACIGTAPNCSVALDRNTSVQAVFVGVPKTLVMTVGGPGRITSSIGAIDCGDGRSVCQAQVPLFSSVTLRPVPSSGGRFGGWTGPCASAGTGPCTLNIDKPYTQIMAAFGHSSPQQGPQTLTVHVRDNGGVSSSPPGIYCEPDRTCAADFPSGTLVVLYALNTGPWKPPCNGGLHECALVIDAPTEVTTPKWTEPPPPMLGPGQLLVTVSGRGLITSSNGAIRCGWAPAPKTQCTETLRGWKTDRFLRAKGRSPFHFSGWGGVCRGKKLGCLAHLNREGHGHQVDTFSVRALFRKR
jgi:hypothetical protein